MSSENIKKLFSSYNCTDEEIVELVNTELPQWKKACDSTEAGAILFHPDAYGYTARELLLLAIAIKYATGKGKEVMIAPKK